MRNRGVVMFAVAATVAAVVAFCMYPPKTSEAMAAWVQAMGAIAAIIWAGKFASDQMGAQRALQEAAAKNAHAHRLENFIAICEVACAEVRELAKSLADDGDDERDDEKQPAELMEQANALLHYAFVSYESRTFEGLSSALGAFPIHELPNARSVGAAQRFRDGFMHASKAVAAWVETMTEIKLPPFEEAKQVLVAHTYINGQLKVLEDCLQKYRSSH